MSHNNRMKDFIVAKTYNSYELHIIDLFNKCENIIWNEKVFNKISACKPKAQGGGGEPKTDVYVHLENTQTNDKEIIKISVKQSNAEFLANKLTAPVAEELFGCDWKEILIQSIESIKSKFQTQEIVYLKPKQGVEQDAFFTLGWKLEITNKARKLSTPLMLDQKEIMQIVYKGINQPESKRNAIVFDAIEENSGVAEYLLEGRIDTHATIESILKDLERLDNYMPENIHLVFTANNYRFKANKADGPRTLAVAIEWTVSDGRLKPHFLFDVPLKFKGEKDMMPLVKSCLEQLNIKSFEDIKINDIKPI